MQNGKSNQGLLQAQGQLILRAYELPQVPKPQSQEVKQGDEEKPVEDPYYVSAANNEKVLLSYH